MNFFAVLILYMIKKMNGNRSIAGSYHILKGKKSAQSLQDCIIFDLTPLFGVLRQIDRNLVEEAAKILLNHSYIKNLDEGYFNITTSGSRFLTEAMGNWPIPDTLDGFKYKDTTEPFWQRLSLYTQCLSNLMIGQNSFVPIVKDPRTQLWIKAHLLRKKTSPISLGNNFFLELESVLNNFSSLEASFFVSRLSGSERIGFTNDQSSQYFNIDPIYARLLFAGVIHGIITEVAQKRSSYPMLNEIIDEVLPSSALTETSKKTLTLLKKGFSLEEISMIRQLKLSTIEDHLVEIALNDSSFSIDSYVSKENQSLIYSIIDQYNLKKLKDIKDKIQKPIPYFAIRLAIAKREKVNELE